MADRARLTTAEARLDGLDGELVTIQGGIEILYDNDSILQNQITGITGYTDTDDVRHPGQIEQAIDKEATSRRFADSVLGGRIEDMESDGFFALASVGGVAGLQTPYNESGRGSPELRGLGVAGAGVGGMMGGYFGPVRLGGELMLYNVNDGGMWTGGMTGTYFFDKMGLGLFVGGGTHESGGEPPVEVAVMGRQALLGVEVVSADPFNGYVLGELALRGYVGYESFGTKFDIEEDTGVDAKSGMVLGLGLFGRIGGGPSGR